MPVMIGGGMVACGYTALRDKKVGDSLNDSKIDVAIKKRLYKVDPKLFSEVSVVTNQGCVLFTGVVSNPEWGGVAEKEAWKVEGVIAVDNNITSGEELTPGQIVKDGFITSSCRSALICASGVRSVNYKIKTANGVVYITGVARTEEELNTTLSKLQNVSGVKKVVSYVNILKK
ncbi:MAG: BON domain-containing protein [Holosporales bacterium]|jgi:osmotically-inducible protein OsmY|nr:BON domain-containing protein [Holosporales bacterium]